MTAPELAHSTEFGRMYSRSTQEAPQVPSITTVISQQATDLTGWAAHLGTTALANSPDLPSAIGDTARMRQLARYASSAAQRFRDDAASRGDRVHYFAEQHAREVLGLPHATSQAFAQLENHQETPWADRFISWWNAYRVEPILPEVTVWNHEVGYAGTLDLVAQIGGRTCIIDFKTKGVDKQGRVKKLSDSVAMQLIAGMRAQEQLMDAANGDWTPWRYATVDDPPVLLAVAIAHTEAQCVQVRPEVMTTHWRKFWALRQVWEYQRLSAAEGIPLQPLGPPPAAQPVATMTEY